MYVCICGKKKRGWCKLLLFIFLRQLNKPTQMVDSVSLKLRSGWYCTQCNYPRSPQKKNLTTLTI